MNKKKRFLDDCHKGEKTNVFSQLQNYYAIKDLDESKNFLSILNALYGGEEKHSYEKTASKFFIGINTFKRYVVMFNELAEKLSKAQHMGG